MASGEAPKEPKFVAAGSRDVKESATGQHFARTVQPGMAAWLAALLSGNKVESDIIFFKGMFPPGGFYCHSYDAEAQGGYHPGGFVLHDPKRANEVKALLDAQTAPAHNDWHGAFQPEAATEAQL